MTDREVFDLLDALDNMATGIGLPLADEEPRAKMIAMVKAACSISERTL